MADFFPTLGAVGRDYATWGTAYTPAAVLAITGSADLIVGGNSIYFQVWDDADFVENVVLEGIPQDAANKIVFQRAVGSGRPKITNSTGRTVWVRDAFVSFENIDFESSGVDESSIAVQLAELFINPYGNRFTNCEFIAVTDSAPLRGGASFGTALYPVTIENGRFRQGNLSGSLVNFTNGLLGLPQAWYVDFINCTMTGAENTFFYRQDDPGDLYQVRLINLEIYGNYTTNDWVTGATNGTLVTTGSMNNVVGVVGALPGLAVTNPLTLTTNPTPGVGDFAIVVDDILYADMRPQDVPDNDLIGAGVGPSANALVPLFDFDGNPRSGATCVPGCFEIPTAPALDNAGLMLGFNF